MQDIQPPKKGKIEKLTQRLYSPNEQFSIRERKKLSQKEFNTQADWNDGSISDILESENPKKAINFFGIFAVIAFLFFAGALGYAGLNFFGGGQLISGNDVDISVIGPVSIGGGEELSLDIVVQNNNQTQLETVDLIIEYPEGTKKADDLKTDLTRLREGLGIVSPNSVVKRTHLAALFGEEGTEKQIEITVEYRLPGSNAIFEKKKVFDIVLQSSPIRLRVNAVKEITPNQELVFDVELGSNSNQVLENVMLVVKYPFGFVLEDSDFETFDGNNVWLFKELRPQEKIKFKIKGRLEGQNTEERVFNFEAGIQDDSSLGELGVIFTKLPKAVTISRPFLDLKLAIDGDVRSDVVKTGAEQIDGKLTYTNNTDTTIQDAHVTLTFNGAVLDKESVRVSDGFYRSGDNSIVWDRNNNEGLREILAGSTGSLSFSFRSKPLANLSSVFKNPEIIIDVVGTGRRVGENNVSEEISSNSFKRIQFASNVLVNSETRYVAGAIPPKVDNQTSYAVVVSIQNSSADISNARVTTVLPNYVRWDNVVSAGPGKISFDPVSREVRWDVAKVPAHAGYTIGKYQISFQVTLTPSVSQKGVSPELTGQFNFSGMDTFVERNIQSGAEAATTNVSGGDTFFDSRVVD